MIKIIFYGPLTAARNYNDFFDGTLDDVSIWSAALTSSEIEKIYWGGDFVKPVVNASAGDFAFKLSAAEAELKDFEVQYSGSDSSDVGVLVTADEVKVYDVLSKYNKLYIY